MGKTKQKRSLKTSKKNNRPKLKKIDMIFKLRFFREFVEGW